MAKRERRQVSRWSDDVLEVSDGNPSEDFQLELDRAHARLSATHNLLIDEGKQADGSADGKKSKVKGDN